MINLEEEASLTTLSYVDGAQLSRHELSINLLGERAEVKSLGLTIAKGEQHVDHRTLIDHQVGHCQSTQIYKSILDDGSRVIFDGQVCIQQKAQKAQSSQINKNLLLSSKAEADSKPQLEILADDVKASHGSTVGQISAEELFYLQSRAVNKDLAVEMLSFGFCVDVLYQIPNDLVQIKLLEKAKIAFNRKLKTEVKVLGGTDGVLG